jgi:hypothetical protein
MLEERIPLWRTPKKNQLVYEISSRPLIGDPDQAEDPEKGGKPWEESFVLP